MSAVRVIGELDRNFAWDGSTLYDGGEPPAQLRGAAAAVEPAGPHRWRVVRDPLGLNKLFWARCEDGAIEFAARPIRLIEQGHPLEDIRAFPCGAVLDLNSSEREAAQYSIAANDEGEPDVGAIAAEIRAKLDGYLAALAAAYPAARVFVCLSGGLDSSGIAVLAREHFSDVVAVSFDLRARGRQASEDRATAIRLARELGMSLLEATATRDELFAHLDTVLVEGIDWRDFNVHAALVNAVLAEAIAAALPDSSQAPSVLVLTGDLANEFLADYHPERYRGSTYYALPRLQPAALRASLVRGLDSCHREIGVFAAWKLPVVQPYAAAVDAYMALPGDFIALEDRKEQLCRAVFGKLLPDYILSRPKVRAQAGSPSLGGGVLAACVDRGIDSLWLRRRFAELHRAADVRVLDRFIRAGRYRGALPHSSGAADGH